MSRDEYELCIIEERKLTIRRQIVRKSGSVHKMGGFVIKWLRLSWQFLLNIWQ